MRLLRLSLIYLCVAVLGLAAPTHAAQILLDIDTDNDPTTINDLTTEDIAEIKMILAPTEPDELFVGIDFGLGGSCLDCEMVHQYGTAFDIAFFTDTEWTDQAELHGTGAYATALSCPADPGFHLLLHIEPIVDYYILSEPIFIATFTAWVAGDVPPGCTQPASNLAVMFEQGEQGIWNYVQLGGEASSVEPSDWARIKTLYR